ncbi:MAG: DUF362 domain-containing protein [Desulfobacterota bacterium]|nr:DUF362 domain-containing protein [Thermodesulfobacteriota bacterium]
MTFRKIITRRDFLRSTAYATLGAAIGSSLTGGSEGGDRVKVVLVRDENAIDPQGHLNAKVVQRMLDEGVCALLEETDPVQAWKRLIKPHDIVGVKSNVWPYLPTPPELEEAIVRRVMDAGVSRKNIAIDDRGVLNNPIFKSSTALINVRPLRTHHWSGIGGCIKNYVMFVPTPWLYHGEACSPLASIWNKPIVRGKTRLNILSLLRTQFYNRGPHHFDPRFVSDYKGLLLGKDPVALDAVGARLLQLQRIAYFKEDKPLETPPTHIFAADEKYRLGVSDLGRIDIVKLGWTEGTLI